MTRSDKRINSQSSKAKKKPFLEEFGDVSILTSSDIQKLVQELRIHQVELEAQNEELKNSQLELQISRDKYLELYNSAPVGNLIVDEYNLITEANDTAAKMLNNIRSLLIGRRITSFIASTRKSQDTFYLCVNRVYKSVESTQQCELEMQRKDQTKFHAQLQIVPVKRDKNRIKMLSISLVDITERIKSEEALKESESILRLLWNTMSRGVVYQDTEGKVLRMNPAAERILGRTPEHYLGKPPEGRAYDTIRPDGSFFPGIEHPSMISLKTGKKVNNVVMGVYNPRERAYRWINVSAVPIFGPGKQKPDQSYIIFDDITERLQAEKALQESEEQFRAIFEHSTIGKAITLVDGTIVKVN